MKQVVRTKTMFATFVAVFGCVVLYAPHVFADDYSSANFTARAPVTNSFGANASSTSFTSVQSGGQTVTGESTSSSFLMHMGFAYFDTFTPKEQNWRWYDDEAHETPTSPLATENVAPSNIADQTILKLRVSVKETAGYGLIGAKFRLQYSTASDFSTGATFVTERAECTSSSGWCYADGGGVDNATISTTVLSDPDSCTSGVGDGCGTHNEFGTSTSSFEHKKNAVTEYEFTIQTSGPSVNTVYFFRLYDVANGAAVPLNTGASYPSITTGGTTLTFTIEGLAAGVSTEGDLTGVSTTPTSIPFGTLPFSTTTTAAQRFTVTTNATQGYAVFAVQQQPLLNEGGAAIDPVTGTDSTPASWSSGCSGGAPSCYGYHSGEDVLSGGSTRFAPNDTFAQFSSSPQEVAYSATPTVGKQTDFLVKIEAREAQEAGTYNSSLMYIIVPVF